MIIAFRTFQSATFCSCFEALTFAAILPSRRVALLRLLFLCSLSFFVNPVSSSSSKASSEARWLNSTSSLVDLDENSELSSEEYAKCFPSPLGIPIAFRCCRRERFLCPFPLACPFSKPAISCARRRLYPSPTPSISGEEASTSDTVSMASWLSWLGLLEGSPGNAASFDGWESISVHQWSAPTVHRAASSITLTSWVSLESISGVEFTPKLVVWKRRW